MGHLITRSRLLSATLVVVILACGFGFSTSVKAANPTTVSFQGKVVNAGATAGTNVTDGTYTFVFKLYSATSGGSALWTETDSSVTVTAGVFQVNLGANCPFFTANACNSSTPIDFNANPSLYLGITFNSDPAGEMTPRVQLQSVPFAFNADKVGGLTNAQLVQLTPSGGQQSGSVNVTSVITPSLTSTGALTINSGAATNVSIDSAGAGTAAMNIGGANATSVAISRLGQTTTVNGALSVNQNATFKQNVVMTFTGTGNLAITSDLAGTVNGISFIGTPSTTAGTTNGAFIQQAASANTNGLDNGLTIDNANATVAIGAAISITNTGGAGYTNYLTAPNTTLAGNGEIYGKGIDYFDPALMTGASVNAGSNGVASGNFGGVASTGAFIGNTDTYAMEFVASLASLTTNNRNVGDSLNWYFNNNAQASVASSDISTTGGFLRIATAATTARGGLAAEGATPGVLDLPLNASNLPIVQMKVRPGALKTTDDLVWGMGDLATAPVTNDALPTNGIFFWTNNSTGVTGWQGVVRSGGANVGTVTCPGNEVANVFAIGRIVVVNATTVRFFIINNAGTSTSFQDCGTVTGTLPVANLAMEMYVSQTTNVAANFDLDYARFWQDDAPVAAPASANTVAIEQLQADIATTTDTTTATVDPTTDPANASNLAALVTASPAVPPPIDASSLAATPANDGTTQLTDATGLSHFNFDATGNASLAGSLSLTDATLQGGLIVGGDSAFNGLSTFQKLATFFGKAIFRQDIQIDGHVTVASDSAGYANFRSGDSNVHVTFKLAYDNPPIVSASVNNGQFALSTISNVTAKGFDISLQNSATTDTIFTWTAVGVNNPQTASNPVVVAAPTTSAN